MSSANSAGAQVPTSTTPVVESQAETQDSTINGSIKVTDTNTDDTVKDTAQSEAAEAAKYTSMAKISEADAMKAAVAKVGGTATKATLGNENGSLVYEVTVGTQDVKVDAGNGKVLSVDTEGNEANEGPEANDANEGPEVAGANEGPETTGANEGPEGAETTPAAI
jgi:uncharacterized membrane protein YkoI